MKILVVSDSHQQTANLEHILKKEADAEAVILFRDGAEGRDVCLRMTPRKQIWRVRGNCDPLACGFKEEQIFDMEGVKLFACHGHKYNVYYGLHSLYFAGLSHNAKVCLYGHTHVQKADETEGILFLNPGTVKDHRYALLFIENGDIEFELKQF
jgi:putative phosphoesterase